jgi:hypothetical protein
MKKPSQRLSVRSSRVAEHCAPRWLHWMRQSHSATFCLDRRVRDLQQRRVTAVAISMKVDGPDLSPAIRFTFENRLATHDAQVRVAGRVTNENDLPVPGALVTVEDIPVTKTWEAISDPTGAFLLQSPSAGPYSLKVDPPTMQTHQLLTTSTSASVQENSQAMAQHLFATQPTTSPGGLFLVILGTSKDFGRCV